MHSNIGVIPGQLVCMHLPLQNTVSAMHGIRSIRTQLQSTLHDAMCSFCSVHAFSFAPRSFHLVPVPLLV